MAKNEVSRFSKCLIGYDDIERVAQCMPLVHGKE